MWTRLGLCAITSANVNHCDQRPSKDVTGRKEKETARAVVLMVYHVLPRDLSVGRARGLEKYRGMLHLLKAQIRQAEDR